MIAFIYSYKRFIETLRILKQNTYLFYINKYLLNISASFYKLREILIIINLYLNLLC